MDTRLLKHYRGREEFVRGLVKSARHDSTTSRGEITDLIRRSNPDYSFSGEYALAMAVGGAIGFTAGVMGLYDLDFFDGMPDNLSLMIKSTGTALTSLAGMMVNDFKISHARNSALERVDEIMNTAEINRKQKFKREIQKTLAGRNLFYDSNGRPNLS